MKYEIWSNTSKRPDRFITGYAPDDTIVRTWSGVINQTPHSLTRWEADHPESIMPGNAATTSATLDYLFYWFNEDSRPNRSYAHSLSVGDVIVLSGHAYAVGVIGFVPLAEFQPGAKSATV